MQLPIALNRDGFQPWHHDKYLDWKFSSDIVRCQPKMLELASMMLVIFSKLAGLEVTGLAGVRGIDAGAGRQKRTRKVGSQPVALVDRVA